MRQATNFLNRSTAARPESAWPPLAPRFAADEPLALPPSTLMDRYGELFVDVQVSGLFNDCKTFVDAVAKEAPASILARYRVEKSATGFSLADFVAAHFQLPEHAASHDAAVPHSDVEQHISALWPQLTRPPGIAAGIDLQPRDTETLLPLPHPYVVPGGRFNEIYYWDTYFTMLGLIDEGHSALAEAMVANFASLIDRYGHVPNGNRSYYLSRSQPPFFFKMLESLAPEAPAPVYARHLAQLQREHAYWMAGEDTLAAGEATSHVVRLADGSVLNRFWDARDEPREESYREDVHIAQQSERDPKQVYRDLRAAAESGWDFSSRWCADPGRLSSIETTSLLPIDLNCLLFGLEQAISAGCAHQGDAAGSGRYAQRANDRLAAIQRHLWSEALGHHVDYHWVGRRQRETLSAAVAMPLFLGIASPAQAERIAQALESQLLMANGLVTTTTHTGQQWDFPNGWAPLQWIAIAGLRQYGQQVLAQQISDRWMRCIRKVHADTGRLLEKYNVVEDLPGGGGEYPTQCGFGWTNGVALRMLSTSLTQ